MIVKTDAQREFDYLVRDLKEEVKQFPELLQSKGNTINFKLGDSASILINTQSYVMTYASKKADVSLINANNMSVDEFHKQVSDFKAFYQAEKRKAQKPQKNFKSQKALKNQGQEGREEVVKPKKKLKYGGRRWKVQMMRRLGL